MKLPHVDDLLLQQGADWSVIYIQMMLFALALIKRGIMMTTPDPWRLQRCNQIQPQVMLHKHPFDLSPQPENIRIEK